MRRTKTNQKGKSRHFSTPEEIQSQMEKLELQGEEGSEESSSEESGSGSEEDTDDENAKPKGVSNLIQIENPNRAPKKANPSEPVQLSRREREEIEKQKAKERYQKLHAAGKTDQAKADLARLALIRQKREDELNKRKEEAKIKEEDSKKKLQQSSRASSSKN